MALWVIRRWEMMRERGCFAPPLSSSTVKTIYFAKLFILLLLATVVHVVFQCSVWGMDGWNGMVDEIEM